MKILEELKSIRTQKGKPHKPLLILLCLSKILKGHVNKFTYVEIEKELEVLIKENSLDSKKSINPQFPFVFLQSSPLIWQCSKKTEDFNNPEWPSKKEMENVVGNFSPEFYNFVLDAENMAEVFYILQNDLLKSVNFNKVIIQLLSF